MIIWIRPKTVGDTKQTLLLSLRKIAPSLSLVFHSFSLGFYLLLLFAWRYSHFPLRSFREKECDSESDGEQLSSERDGGHDFYAVIAHNTVRVTDISKFSHVYLKRRALP